mmetsp:Transcript_41656/g.124536  ORF Transcript_41656/g.124536 Transcript_41656/m.124536 type:complete len:209 (+) Transcript_41656:196-822(+)
MQRYAAPSPQTPKQSSLVVKTAQGLFTGTLPRARCSGHCSSSVCHVSPHHRHPHLQRGPSLACLVQHAVRCPPRCCMLNTSEAALAGSMSRWPVRPLCGAHVLTARDARCLPSVPALKCWAPGTRGACPLHLPSAPPMSCLPGCIQTTPATAGSSPKHPWQNPRPWPHTVIPSMRTQKADPGLRPPGGRPRPPPSAAPQAPRPQRSPR